MCTDSTFTTLRCRASRRRMARHALEAALMDRGLHAVASAAEAELVVLNSCTVTAFADEDVRKTVRRVHRENPEARILVTGCYAQRAPQEIAVLPGVAWVVGNSHKVQIPDIVGAAPAETPYHGEIRVADIFAQSVFLSAPVEDAAGDRTRPNLKIQDGCNNRGSFCIMFLSCAAEAAARRWLRWWSKCGTWRHRYREVVLSAASILAAGAGNGETPSAWRIWFERCWTKPRSSDCGSAQWSRWTGRTTCYV